MMKRCARGGVSSYANMGGGGMSQETGSHVDTHTWNAILALGYKNEKERGTFEYGAFFEYGTGNYTTQNGDERGDGLTHYTGGGNFRGEIGATVTPDKNSPVKLDLNITGFAGKKRGFSGGVSVAFMF